MGPLFSWASVVLAVVVLSACAATTVVGAVEPTLLGSITLTSPTKLASEYHRTLVTLQSSSNHMVPTLQLSIEGSNLPTGLTLGRLIAPPDADGWTSLRDVFNLPAIDSTPPATAPSSSSSNAPVGSVDPDGGVIGSTAGKFAVLSRAAFAVVLVSVSFLAFSTRPGWLMIALVVAACTLTMAPQPAWAPGSATYHVTIFVPIGTVTPLMGLRIADGSVTSSSAGSISFGALNLDLCSASSATSLTTVSLGAIAVQSSADICANGDVSITAMRQLATNTVIRLESKLGAVGASFAAAPAYGNYLGAFSVSANQVASVMGGSCLASVTNTTQSKVGTCGGSSAASFTVLAGTNAAIELGQPGIVDGGSPAAPQTAMRPAWTRNYAQSSSDWKAFNSRGNGDLTVTTNEAKTSLTVQVKSGAGNVFWLISSKYAPTMRPDGTTYSMTVTSTTSTSAIASIGVGLFESFSWDNAPWGLNPDWHLSASGVVRFVPSSGSSPRTASWTIPGSRPIGGAYLGIRVELSSVPSGSWNITFDPLTLNSPSGPYLLNDLITSVSNGYVQIPKMPAALDPNPRGTSDCPHLESGLLEWSNPATWGGAVPAASTPVITLPAGTKVVISSASSVDPTALYQKIVIPADSELIFADADISWNVRGIEVNGAMRLGSSTCRLNSRIVITFHGEKTTADEICTSCGSKGIAVSTSGRLEVHGFQYHFTWSRLSSTVYPGDDRVTMMDSTNWEVGQKIAVTTTLFRDYFDGPGDEVRTIIAITDNGKTIQVDRPFEMTHYAGWEYQAEVVLISRRIVLQGDDSSEANQFGGHTICRGMCRYSGALFFRMGQTNMLARYPIHFHMIGNCPECFVRDCSVYRSFFRCVAIHATNEVTITRTTSFDVVGHCYYLEEGIEENNTLSFNFAGYVKTVGKPIWGSAQAAETLVENENLTLPADGAASGFYLTNAWNRIVGNAASGGWACFSFPNLPKPIGFSKNINFSPEKRNLLEFDGNTMHSSAYFFEAGGGCIYVGGKLYYNADGKLVYDAGRNSRQTKTTGWLDDTTAANAWMKFTNTKAFLCEMGLSHWGDRLEVIGFETHDIRRSAQLFGVGWLDSALVNAKSGNPVPNIDGIRGFQYYDTWVQTIISNITFMNIWETAPVPDDNLWLYDNRGIITMSHSDSQKPQGIAAIVNAKWINVPFNLRIKHKLVNTGSAKYYAIVDWDGSVSGTGRKTMIGSAYSDWWKLDDSCTLQRDWNMWLCDIVDESRKVGYINILIPNLIGSEFQNEDRTCLYCVGNMTLFGPGIPAGQRWTDVTANPGVGGSTGLGWFLQVHKGSPTKMDLKPSQMPHGTFVMFAIQYPAGTTFSISVNTWINVPAVTAVNSFAEVLNGDGFKYYFDGKHLYLKVLNAQVTDQYWSWYRAGVRVYTQDVVYTYQITANCPGVTAGTDVYCNTGPTQFPALWV